MKNLLMSLLTMGGLIFCTSCDKPVMEPVATIIDQITVFDKNSNVLQEYQYDRTNEAFIGEGPAEKLIVIKGTIFHKEDNDSGGQNYFCFRSEEICYANH